MAVKSDEFLTGRQAQIVETARSAGTIRIGELARGMGVSEETIRRDIRPLVETGALIKHHGAVSPSHSGREAPFERRMRENAAEKLAIARHVASMISDGDSVMLDTGTTTSILARELLSKAGLTIVTNSSDIARTLAIVNGNTVFMAGGELHGDNGAAFGRSAIEFVRNFSVRFAIISIAAVNETTGLMDHQLAEAELARTVLTCGQQRIVITDHTKFSRTALVKACDFSDFDLLVTDSLPPPAVLNALKIGATDYHVVSDL